MANKICKICNKIYVNSNHRSLYCNDECKKKALCQNVKNYSLRKDNRCVSCGKSIGYKNKKCKNCSAKSRHKRGDIFGFCKNHKDYRTREGIDRMAKKLSMAKRGIHLDTNHLKQYQFKKGHQPWNKNNCGYKLKKLYGWTEEAREKHSLAVSRGLRGKPRFDKRGKNSHFWKGGISKLRDRIHQSFRYREWRRLVFERDNFTCQNCGIRSGNGKAVYLEAHHKREFHIILKENNIKTVEQALDCKEL